MIRMIHTARWRAALIGFVAVLSAGSAEAQTISPGRSVSGALAATDAAGPNGQYQDSYRLDGRAGQRLRINLDGEGIDTLVRITGPNGFAQENDDANGSLNAQLDVTLPANGRYTIVATTYGPQVVGGYTLRVSDLGRAEAAAPIRVGQNVNGTLRNNDATRAGGQFVDSYTFQGEYGQQIEVRMNARTFDPLLAITGPGNFQAENDDDTDSSEPLRNSRLVLTLPQAGVYTVQASSYSAGATGDYSLRISPASGAPQQSAGVSQGEVLTPGQPARGALAQGDGQLRSGEFADSYRFLGQAGQRVTIDMRSSELDAYLIVVPPEGDQIDNDDFEGLGTNSRVELTLTASGEYRVIATTYRPGETGAYEVLVSDAGERELAGASAPGEDVGLNETVTGALAQGDATLDSGEFYDTYSFNGRRGQTVTIEMASAEIDTYLILLTPSGETQQNDDGIPGTTNSRLTWTLPASGEYTIVATSYAPGERGAYTLRVNRGAAVAGGPTAAGAGRVFVLSVGISDYAGYASNLAYTADDARNLYSAMQSSSALAPESVVLTDAQATRANVEAAFQRIAAQVGPNDLFLFFYSGHGSQEAAAGSGELDERDESIVLRDGLITDNEMAQWFSQVNGRLSVIALDSCFSGGFARDVVNRPRVMGLFSSDEDLTSAVADKFRAGGYLSHFLIEAMQGQADENADRTITAGELHAYLWRRFAAEDNIGASTMDGESNYQRLVVDRGGVKIDDTVIALRS
jgi:hypothetical protein